MAQANRLRGACLAQVQTEPGDHCPVLDGDHHPIAPADASGQQAHGGGPVLVDDVYDTKIKIGEALEAAARVVGDQPVRRSDAEARAGMVAVIPGGVAEQAQAAADANARAAPADAMVTVGDVLAWNATAMLPTEKAVTAEDAAAAAEPEAASDPGKATQALRCERGARRGGEAQPGGCYVSV